MSGAAKAELLDLEKELTCSICREVLYQPLTLLDCLHTFCGSCLREWFSWQALRPASDHPYTCPSCRATVRDTRPNATVTTLLEMFLQAHPSKSKSDDEKREMARTYKPGDSVLPPVLKTPRRRDAEREDEEDRRLLADVRELSLREMESGASAQSGRDFATRASHRPRGADQAHEGRHRGHRRPEGGSHVSHRSRNTPSQPPERQLDHQSSLRSLMSHTSEVDSSEREEEIIRQIIEEGLLDGIDLSTIDVSQEDEISERIADAYRRRQRQQAGNRHTRAEESEVSTSSHRASNNARHRPNPSSTTRLGASVGQQNLDVSATNDVERRRRRSSHNRRSTSPAEPTLSLSTREETRRAANRSATDLSERRTSDQIPPSSRPGDGLSSQGRRTTDPDSRRSPDQNRPQIHSSSRAASLTAAPAAAAATTSSPQAAPSSSQSPSASSRLRPPEEHRSHHRSSSSNSSNTTSRPGSSSSNTASTVTPSRNRQALYPEPSITCSRCQTPSIEYTLHYNCGLCDAGALNLCLSCYRQGKGCLHWFGFGSAAMIRYKHLAPPGGYPPSHSPPHTLMGRRYSRPRPSSLAPTDSNSTHRPRTTEDPARRLQKGVFCSRRECNAFANSCWWKCAVCNEGEWGYCHRCVNSAQCCTHSLLPLTGLFANDDDPSASEPASPRPLFSPKLPPSASLLREPGLPSYGTSDAQLRPLTFTIPCTQCHLPIQPSSTRYHCWKCSISSDSTAEHEICTPCYLKLCSNGTISRENGNLGWRRCLKGHRMLIVGFEDSDEGRRRVVVKDVVGGWAVNDPDVAENGQTSDSVKEVGLGGGGENWTWRDGPEGQRHYKQVSRSQITSGPSSPTVQPPATTTNNAPVQPASPSSPLSFPPSGGIGLRCVARWLYFPPDACKGDLTFPRNAEIREAEAINEDWFWGVYERWKGLFPSGYVVVIGKA
ncbi:MAG: hypothetical protein M1817_004628 [Caeruleum heppii]|nr:MAG: hypothetical protein M1817_004628 [Caeruleum heppii]